MSPLVVDPPPSLLLDTPESLDEGFAALRRLDPLFERLAAEGLGLPLRKRAPGLAGLLRIVVGQQVSTASAAAIAGRLEAAFPAVTAAGLAAATDEQLRTVGLSAPKMKTMRAISAAILESRLGLERLHDRGADAAHAELVAVPGIGPWTADAYLLFCLGHADAFPAGDLALQEAARLLLGLEARPRAADLTAHAERWRPWRGVAAFALWAYYAKVKGREGVPVATPAQPIIDTQPVGSPRRKPGPGRHALRSTILGRGVRRDER